MTNKMSNSKTQRKRRAWPQKQRENQAKNCHKTKPWKKATGPKIAEGKQAVKNNAYRHGRRSEDGIALRKLMYAQQLFVSYILRREQI